MKRIMIVIALFVSGCIAAINTNQEIDNSPSAMAKREATRQELCNKHHYPGVKFIRVGGKMEVYKIHAELSEKTAYECRF